MKITKGGAPVAGADVTGSSLPTNAGASGKTDANGVFCWVAIGPITAAHYRASGPGFLVVGGGGP